VVAKRDTTRLNAVGNRVVNQARQDLGFQEHTNRNDHPIYSHYRTMARLGNRRDRKGNYLPTCGAAVYTWHLQAGVKPNVASPGRALSWSTSAKRDHRYELGPDAKPGVIARLRPGMVCSFRFKNQNHVGIIEQVYPLYAVTDEANTSTKGSVGFYTSTKYGVICKIRFYAIVKEAIDWRDSPETDSLIALNDRKRYISPKMDSLRAARLSQPPPEYRKPRSKPTVKAKKPKQPTAA